MISQFESQYHLSNNYFRQVKAIIERSRVATTIASYHADGAGGAPRDGIEYTLTAVLVSALTLITLGRAPTYKAILGAIADLTPRQLSEVGMAGQNVGRIHTPGPGQYREYQRFITWLDRQLKPLDPSPDQPATRITNAQHEKIVRARTAEQRQAYDIAAERLRTVINDIVAGSIVTKQPAGAVGDIVADETIFDLAGPSSFGLGVKPGSQRGACYFGRFYARGERSGPLLPDDQTRGSKKATKYGFGVGVTVVTRIGAPDRLHAVPALMVGLDIHEPSSGRPDAVGHAIRHMKRNGLDTRPTTSNTWPRATVDMGYNPKDDFMALMIDEQYTPVVRYPKEWSLTETSAHPAGTPETRALPGPLQFAGAFYCPAAEQALRNHIVPKSRELLASKGWDDHDNRLTNTLPFLMGTNSRPIVNGKRGRPRLGETPQRQVKLDLVCPAVQGRVRCPLKPASMTRDEFGTPLADPTWTADEHLCCKQSSVRVALTSRQLKKAQWGPVGGTWEHMTYFEAARAATEQRFSLLKSPHITGITEMRWGPRREPMVKILLALAIAATNHQIQKTHSANAVREESIDIRWRQLQRHLGHEPTRTPPRT